MITVAITGNIGTGKSLVSSILAGMGFPVYLADKEASKFLDEPEVIMKITDRFGLEVLSPDGLPDRKKIAALVFEDPKALQWLNSTIHPLVFRDWSIWLDQHRDAAFCFMESAIIFENSLEGYFDAVVLVDAPVEIAIRRVMERDNVPKKDVEARLKHQWPSDQKREKAFCIIHNDGKRLLLPQVLELLEKLKEK